MASVLQIVRIATPFASVSSASLTITGVTAGSVLLVHAELEGDGRSIAGVTDTGAASGWAAKNRTNDGGAAIASDIWGLANAAAGSHALTVAFDFGASGILEIIEVGGVDTTSPFDKQGGAGTYGSSISSGSLTPATASTIAIALGTADQVGGSLNALGGAWTDVDHYVPAGLDWNTRLSSQELSSTTAIAATQARTNSGPVISQLLILKKSSGGGASVATGVGALTVTGFAPSVGLSSNQNVASGVGVLSVTGFAPTVAVPRNVASGVGLLTVTGFAPSATTTANVTVASGAGQLAATGFAPTATPTQNVFVLPGVGVVVATGFAPAATTSGNQNALTATGLATLTGLAPSVQATANQNVLVGLGVVTLSGFAPSVQAGAGAITGTGAITITAFAPNVAATANRTVLPGTGVVVAIGFAPNVSAPNAIATALGQLLATGFAPTTSIRPLTLHLDEPLSIDFTSLARAIDFDVYTKRLVFLEGGSIVFELTILQGEVEPIAMVLQGADPVTGVLEPYDVSAAAPLTITVKPKSGAAIINAAALTKVDAANGKVSYTPQSSETASPGRYDALVIATFAGSPQLVRKFPGKLTIKDAIA